MVPAGDESPAYRFRELSLINPTASSACFLWVVRGQEWIESFFCIVTAPAKTPCKAQPCIKPQEPGTSHTDDLVIMCNFLVMGCNLKKQTWCPACGNVSLMLRERFHFLPPTSNSNNPAIHPHPHPHPTMKFSINKFTLAAASLALLSSAAQAAVLAQYQFPSASVTATTVLAGVTAGNFAFTSTVDEGVAAAVDGGFSAAGNAFNRADTTGSTQANALADDDFFSVVISATNVGQTLNLSSVTFSLTATNDNTDAFTTTAYLQSSVGGFGTGNPVITGTGNTATQNTLGISAASSASFDLSAPAFQGLSTITFQVRFSDSVGNNNGELARFDDFTLNGTVVPEPSAAFLGGLGLLALLRRRR
jgi:hypothetical protein